MLWQSSVSSSSSTMVWSWRIMHGVEALRRLDMVPTGDAAFFWMDHWPRPPPLFRQWWCERGRDSLRASVILGLQTWMQAGPLCRLCGEAASAGGSQREEPVAKIPESSPSPGAWLVAGGQWKVNVCQRSSGGWARWRCQLQCWLTSCSCMTGSYLATKWKEEGKKRQLA